MWQEINFDFVWKCFNKATLPKSTSRLTLWCHKNHQKRNERAKHYPIKMFASCMHRVLEEYKIPLI